MQVLSIYIQKFRKMLNCHINISNKTTLFVGATIVEKYLRGFH